MERPHSRLGNLPSAVYVAALEETAWEVEDWERDESTTVSAQAAAPTAGAPIGGTAARAEAKEGTLPGCDTGKLGGMPNRRREK